MVRRMLAGALALSLAGVMGGVQPASAARTRVKIVDFAFEPKRKAIPQGTKVTWTNKGDESHTVTSNTGKFDSGTLNPGESFTKRFNRTGVFKYHCEIHPEMVGKIIPSDV
ncbi:MAG: cupredoxin domain-containing protein [Actinomycetota bacterium]